MDFNKVLYGNSYYYYKSCDIALKCFDNSDYIGKDRLHSRLIPPDFDMVFEFLSQERMVVINTDGTRITQRGKMKRATGGFLVNVLINRIKVLGIIIGIIAGIFGLFIH